MMSATLPGVADAQIRKLIEALDSILDGELAVTKLVACGNRAVPHLEQFLLNGKPRSVALPRCRAAHALGELAAYSALITYFLLYKPPSDAVVLFAEDAVRSTAAEELLRWKSEEVFEVLLHASKQRATSGVIMALGEFRKPESVPLLFHALEDDVCRDQAKQALRKIQDAAQQYAILSFRNLTETQLYGSFALRRRRAVLQLLCEFGVSVEEWKDLRYFLAEQDTEVVIATASIGSRLASDGDQREIIHALFRVSRHLNWAQEDEVARLLDKHRELARQIGGTIAEDRLTHGEKPNWLIPFWRVLRHVLGPELAARYGAA